MQLCKDIVSKNEVKYYCEANVDNGIIKIKLFSYSNGKTFHRTASIDKDIVTIVKDFINEIEINQNIMPIWDAWNGKC